MNAPRRCAVCRGPLPPDSRQDRRTCSDRCRQRAIRARSRPPEPPPSGRATTEPPRGPLPGRWVSDDALDDALGHWQSLDPGPLLA